jgi:hypothetical protein
MPDENTNRCVRCHRAIEGQGYLMAGRLFCSQSCSVGAPPEQQGFRRPANVRRYDSMFDRFKEVARRSGPFEPVQPGGHESGGH